MQSLDIISVNLWSILISLCNLLLLFLILKKFLYKPVKKAMESRRKDIDDQYEKANIAENNALKVQNEWDEKMQGAEAEATKIIKEATESADKRGEKIVLEAKEKANEIVNKAKADSELEYKKSESKMKEEIVDISSKLTEKMLDREINEQDHRNLIDSFIKDLGEDDE